MTTTIKTPSAGPNRVAAARLADVALRQPARHPSTAPERGCVLLDQPQDVLNFRELGVVCRAAAGLRPRRAPQNETSPNARFAHCPVGPERRLQAAGVAASQSRLLPPEGGVPAEAHGQNCWNFARYSHTAVIALMFLLLVANSMFAQDRLGSNQPVSLPSGAPALVAAPTRLAEPIPDFPGNSGRAKSKEKFAEVPPEFFNAPTPAPSNLVSAVNAMAALDEKHLLAIGDLLSFRIVEDEEDPRRLLVTDSGELEVPYLGRFPAAGQTCKELAMALKAELEKEYYYRATVIIAVDQMTRSRGKVYLVGPVRMPGPQEIPSDEVLTVSKAILRAGGFTEFADKKTVKITRQSSEAGGTDQTFTVNVGEILERGRTDTDLPLRPGDLIYIEERMIRF